MEPIIDRMGFDVIHNEAAQRFEARVEGLLSVADYRRAGSRVTFMHTEVPPMQRGRGIAAAMAGAALEWARSQQLGVVPACSYFAHYMQRHPSTQDLLDAGR